MYSIIYYWLWLDGRYTLSWRIIIYGDVSSLLGVPCYKKMKV